LVTVAYTALVTGLLVYSSYSPDPEAVIVWLFFGLPWSMVAFLFGRFYWIIVLLNALTLYFGIIFGIALYRKYRKS
jgi:hypothetical protein